MANRRTSPNTLVSSTASSPPSRKKSLPRRSPPTRKRSSNTRLATSAGSSQSKDTATSSSSRPVLVPLHPNLRRLPSRTMLAGKRNADLRVPVEMDASLKVGAKRKRVASTNENVASGGRPTRGGGRLKRQRSNSGHSMESNSEESDASSMDIDQFSMSRSSESDGGEDEEEVDEDEDEDTSSEDYLINTAPSHQLLRLRKDDLVRLYGLAGLCDDAEHLTKSDIVEALIATRDDMASMPPSSPPGGSSDYSSDDGHVEDIESPDRPSPQALRRRATTNGFLQTRPNKWKGRSLSMGTLHGDALVAADTAESCEPRSKKKSSHGSNGSSRRRTTSRSSPIASTSAAAVMQSPPAAHTRSRKVSAETTQLVSISTPILNHSRKHAKGKGKQVEFDDRVQPFTPTKRKSRAPEPVADESDLTELEELEASIRTQPSPRRLRSKDRLQDHESGHEQESRRITPMRKAKVRIKSLKESDTDETMDEEEASDGDNEDEDEVDELVTPQLMQRTPMRRRLRSGSKEHESASDGDDEEEGEENIAEEEEEDIAEDEEEDIAEDEEEDIAEEEEEEADEEAEDEDDEATIAVEPRRLRNGKIVGEDDDAEMDAVEEEVGEDEGVDVESIDLEVEGDTEEEEEEEEEADDQTIEDDEVDLTIATTKTLVRLRRDDLVRLCEARDLEPAGTKPQLAEALLQWRDQQEPSSRSSTGTVRPPSTVKRARRRLRNSKDTTVPLLLRSDHMQPDEPMTPHGKESQEPELELDLGNLGLEDREIPPDKLQKLEKIGSGGFKDVFIGKFKGRKIAISEFRGQLSSMDIKELKLLGGFDHPNIVRFIGVSIPENTKDVPVMIVSELCSNGDLFDYIRNVNPPSLHKVLLIMLDIARGVEYLHLRKPSVIHRDCKSSNILITSKGTAKIADFGLAKVKQSTRSMVRSLVGTVNWQAPELWHAHPKYNHKVDVFSCAMVYWEMLQWHQPTKKFPWEGMNEHAIYEIVGTKRQRPSITGLKKQWCPEVVALMERMWAHEHEHRPTISEVVEELEDLVKRY